MPHACAGEPIFQKDSIVIIHESRQSLLQGSGQYLDQVPRGSGCFVVEHYFFEEGAGVCLACCCSAMARADALLSKARARGLVFVGSDFLC